ncbi:HAMP domain-containing sensor histidine kinase [Streptomyces albidoflavus]|uniref:HAMP domain-containing sensor histidine kinase n=1 Tax=Streptomyces albidoflavus TaxID=1886 RepID=UPI0036F75DAA
MRRLGALPLRARLALLVAAAVALAVAAVSVACWFVVRGKLYEEIDSQLRAQNQPQPTAALRDLLADCPSEPAATGPGGFGRAQPELYLQLVTADGQVCVAEASAGVVEPDAADLAVAAGGPGHEPEPHDATAADGTEVRVLAAPALGKGPPPAHFRNTAIVYAYSLEETRDTLDDLALLLLLVSGVGVVGAGGAGLWIARSGLRPVDRLTEAVEEVARTRDLTVRIPVDGDDEIARLSASFNAMTSALSDSHDLQQQLIADAGHELRTPLTSLRTNIELLARSERTGRALPAEDRAALLDSVKAQMTELAALIGDLQELSRTDGAQQGRLEVVAFHETTATALRRARLRGPELTFTADLAPWYVRCRPAALERAVVNILDNAVKFSPPGGTVDLRLHRGELTVRDRGPGIPEDELRHVFDRFWRSPSARALPGSGLGLSIVARTAEQCGGTVAVERAEGGGTLVRLVLPGAPTPPPGAERTGEGEGEGEGAGDRGPGAD